MQMREKREGKNNVQGNKTANYLNFKSISDGITF